MCDHYHRHLWTKIKSIDYGDGWMDVHCRGTLSQSDSYIGYEGYLSYNNQFKYSIQVSQAVNVVDGTGNVYFSSLDTGYSYYIKVKSAKLICLHTTKKELHQLNIHMKFMVLTNRRQIFTPIVPNLFL